MGKHLIAEGCVIGEPQPSEHCTVEYLKSLGLVGFYLQTNDYQQDCQSMNAYQFMQWLRTDTSDRKTGIDTPYSSVAFDEYSVMYVNDVAVLDELTQEQRLEFSQCLPNGIHVLNIWTHTYISIPQVPDIWVCVSQFNQYNANHSWLPDCVIIDNYLVHIDDTEYTVYVKA